MGNFTEIGKRSVSHIINKKIQQQRADSDYYGHYGTTTNATLNGTIIAIIPTAIVKHAQCRQSRRENKFRGRITEKIRAQSDG